MISVVFLESWTWTEDDFQQGIVILLECYKYCVLLLVQVVDDVYERFKDRLTSLDLTWLDPAAFSDAVSSKGAALNNCWGFIDGTVRPIARPTHSQRIMFSGHKRVHCIKFQVCTKINFISMFITRFLFIQSVVTPNGLIAHLFGPIEGRRHDAFMLAESGVTQKLAQFNQSYRQPYVIYGDPAYGVSRNILTPFRGAQLTNQQHRFNKSMSQVRVCVEWTFGKICQYFTYIDFKRNNKVLLQPIAKYYMVAALLTNCHTCLFWFTDKFFF